MIQITLEKLVNNSDGLKQLGQKSLKARSAYTVGKILKAADAEISSFNEARVELIKKYGEKDENGELVQMENGNIRIEPEHLQDFTQELQELLSAPVEINANKIKMDDLENIEFTPSEMVQLEDFIEFGEE